jgi:hypothetical protein
LYGCETCSQERTKIEGVWEHSAGLKRDEMTGWR